MIKNINSFLRNSKKRRIAPKVIAASILMGASMGAFSHDAESTMELQGQSSYSADAGSSLVYERPSVPVYNFNVDNLKMVEVGDSALDSEDNISKLNALGKMALFADSDKSMQGYALIFEKEKNNIADTICMIAHEQPQDRLYEGFYIDPNRQISSMLPQHYVDFFVKSHEAGHCSFTLLNRGEDNNPSPFYVSTNEVAADLTAVIDYMRVTGNDDIYQDFIRPLRIGSIGMSTHKTAWALDVILKDVSPSAMQNKEASEIPEIVNFLMQKHMLNEAGDDIDYEKKAAKNMALEIMADLDISNNEVNHSEPRMTEKLKKDAADTVFKQIQRYSTIVDNQDLITHHIENLTDSIERHDLPDPKGHWRPKMEGLDKPISKHSYAEHYLGR